MYPDSTVFSRALVHSLEARHLLPAPSHLTLIGPSHCLGECADIPFDLQWHWANDELHVWFKYATNSLLFRSHREGENPAPSLSLSLLLQDADRDHPRLSAGQPYLTFEDLPAGQPRQQRYDAVTQHLDLIFPVNP